MNHLTRKHLIVPWLAAASGLFGVSLAVSPARADLPTDVPPPPPIIWKACASSTFPNRDCANLTVPLDYANLGAGTIQISVARARATGNKVGVLVYNPGGPGFGATGTIGYDNLDREFTPLLQSRFDIVTFQPRGADSGIDCISKAQEEQYWESNLLPRTTTEQNSRIAFEHTIGAGCLDRNDPPLRHLDTASVVRDMEQLRRAMGIETFNFEGRSYGTFIGYRYAKLYPGRLRAMVLDAVVDRSVSDVQAFQESNAAFERMWTDYKAWCQVTANNCKMRGQNIDAVFDQVLANARINPIPAPRALITQRPVNDWILTFIAQALAQPGDITFNSVDQLVYESSIGDASLARYFYDAILMNANGTYPRSNFTHRAIVCVDTTWSQTLHTAAEMQTLINQSKAAAPRFGESGVSQGPTACMGWPVPPIETPPLATAVTNVPPVLLVAGTLDSSTPLLWATRINSLIAGSRLLTRDGYGHISYDKSRCVQQKVDDYLINLTLPAAGTHCATDPDLYPPQGLLLPPLP